MFSFIGSLVGFGTAVAWLVLSGVGRCFLAAVVLVSGWASCWLKSWIAAPGKYCREPSSTWKLDGLLTRLEAGLGRDNGPGKAGHCGGWGGSTAAGDAGGSCGDLGSQGRRLVLLSRGKSWLSQCKNRPISRRTMASKAIGSESILPLLRGV